MIAAMIQGTLASDPVRRTSAKGQDFATAQIRVPVGAESVFVGLVTFSEEGVERLLRLGKGSVVAAAGVLDLNVWTDREGKERRDWRCTANEVISVNQARRRRDGSDGRSE